MYKAPPIRGNWIRDTIKSELDAPSSIELKWLELELTSYVRSFVRSLATFLFHSQFLWFLWVSLFLYRTDTRTTTTNWCMERKKEAATTTATGK